MIRRTHLPAIFAFVTAAMLVTSGIAGTAFAAPPTDNAQEDPIDGETVVDAFLDRMDSLETVQYTHTVTYEDANVTTTSTVVADLESSLARTEIPNRNTTTITNETHVTTYNAETNQFSEVERDSDTILPELTPLANDSQLEYEYLGIETVDGQNTFAIALTPELGAEMDYHVSITLYLDMRTYFPVQSVTEWTHEGESYQSTATFDDVVLDEPVDRETFELDVPENVTDQQNEHRFTTTEYESHETVTADAKLSVPDSELGSFEFDSARIIESDGTYAVTMEYADGEDTLRVTTQEPSESASFDFNESSSFEAVSVGETTGYLATSEGFVTLVVEDDQRYVISGQLDAETAVDIGATLLDS